MKEEKPKTVLDSPPPEEDDEARERAEKAEAKEVFGRPVTLLHNAYRGRK